MQLVHTIKKADVGDGVYRHPLRDPRRALLVEISAKFGGIMLCDVGKRVYRSVDGQLVLQGSHPAAK